MMYNSISSLIYRVYINKQGWKLTNVVKKPLDVINIVTELHQNETHTLVICHDVEYNSDCNVYSITTDEDLSYFIDDLTPIKKNDLKILQKLPNTTKN